MTHKAVRKKAITAEREAGMPGDRVALRLVHAHCRQWRLTAFSVPGTSARRDPVGLLEPGAVKAARRVLRGPRRSNAPGLPYQSGIPLNPTISGKPLGPFSYLARRAPVRLDGGDAAAGLSGQECLG